jgi:hypothetical protein
MRFSVVKDRSGVAFASFDCAPGGGNNLQNNDQGSGESYGWIRAWGLWYTGSPNARDPGHPA